ncbi:MAG: hypothetical protein V3R96_01055 [Dehalococcoidales bacterium]
MKSKFIISVVIVAIGAIIGTVLTFFSSGFTGTVDLTASALFGALVGFCFAMTAGLPVSATSSHRRSGMG